MPIIPVPIVDPSPIDLVTAEYATQVLAAGGVTLTPAQATILSPLITAASREIIRYCGNRVFPLATFTEILTPEGTRQDRGEPASAKTSQFPIQDVVSVMTGRQTCLTIRNTDASTNQIAQVAFSTDGDPEFLDLTYTGIVLTRWSNGVKATDSLSFAGHPTVAVLATAINTLGNGWAATAAGPSGNVDPGKFPSASLVGVREPKDALCNGACLDLFLTPASAYQIERSTGIMRVAYGSWGGWEGFFGDSLGGGWDGAGWGGGSWGWGQYQVTYKSGWAVVPGNLQLVCAEVTKGMLSRLTVDPSLKTESADKYSYTLRDVILTLPEWATQILTYYKDWSV